MQQFIPVFSKSCPNCHHVINFFDTESVENTCHKCHTKINAQGVAIGTDKPFPKHHALKIGMVGTFFNTPYKIVGIAKNQIKEFQHDEEYGYERFIRRSNEYTLINQQKEYLYIEDCENQFAIYQPTTFNNSQVANFSVTDSPKTKKILELDILEQGLPRPIEHFGSSKQLFYYGEKNYQLQTNELSGFLVIEKKSELYEQEWRFVDNKVLEIESFKRIKTNKLEVFKSFGLEKLVGQLKKRINRSINLKKYSIYALIVGILMLLFSFVANTVGNTIIHKYINTTDISEDGLLLGPLELNAVNRLHTLSVSGNISNNAYYSIGVDLLDQDQDLIKTHELEVWHESGGSGEDYWSESDHQFDKKFKLSKKGNYYLLISHWKGSAAGKKIDIHLKENTLEPVYLKVFGIIIIIASILFIYGTVTNIQSLKK